ncbi:hypothetical protein LWI28_025333 [Acer negundo]|uniref:Uncharacterized protein n=1 Tax=Acer negundo TaxID=4023 RepID=A0AAD5J179_ACENE|nr:hypothetical protein LWI28_025333 [Acer negundo]
MDTNKVSGDIESSPFAPWLLVSCGSKYGRKGNGGIGNIGKASNEGRMSGGGFQAVKIGVENISIDGVLGNGEVGNSENYGSKNGKTSKHAFDKVGDPRFEVLNEEMDKSSVPATPSSVPTATVPIKSSRLRFMCSNQTVGHDVERRSPVQKAVLDHLERRFVEVISVAEALREEVHKSDKERNESDKVRREQHKELVCMIQTFQGTSTQMHTDEPFHYEALGVTPWQGIGR